MQTDRRNGGLRVIALYKAVKTIALILVAVAAFHLDRSKKFEYMVHWLEQLSLSDSNGLRRKLMEQLQSMGPRKFLAVVIVALVPVEIYDAVHRLSSFKVAALIAIILIVVYLVRVALQSMQARSVG